MCYYILDKKLNVFCTDSEYILFEAVDKSPLCGQLPNLTILRSVCVFSV